MAEKIQYVLETTKRLNKHGELKGKGKKEKKLYKAECLHHIYEGKKKLKLEPYIYPSGDGYCTCYACGRRFPVKLFDKEDINNRLKNIKEPIEQAKFMAVAVGAGKEMTKYFHDIAVVIEPFPKYYKKLRKVAEKQDIIKKRKKGKNYHKTTGGSAQYGSWGAK